MRKSCGVTKERITSCIFRWWGPKRDTSSKGIPRDNLSFRNVSPAATKD
jgi:hypothetical protein